MKGANPAARLVEDTLLHAAAFFALTGSRVVIGVKLSLGRLRPCASRYLISSSLD